MQRRTFLKTAAAGATAATLAAPAIAQDKRQWKMVTAWPKNLPGPGVAAQMLADRITALSGGRIEVKLFAAGELVPGRGVFDAVSEGTAELYHAVPAYWGSKSKGILMFGSQPFGLRADEQVGWLTHGGGQALYDEMYGRFGLKPFLCGNSGPQWQGWFRKEINSADDLQGLRFRTTGLASEMCAKLGMAVQAMGGARHVPGAAIGRARRRRVHRPVDRQRARLSTRLPRTTTGRASASRPRPRNAASIGGLQRPARRSEAGGRLACESLYNPVWTEYTTKHARRWRSWSPSRACRCASCPTSVIVAMGTRRAR